MLPSNWLTLWLLTSPLQKGIKFVCLQSCIFPNIHRQKIIFSKISHFYGYFFNFSDCMHPFAHLPHSRPTISFAIVFKAGRRGGGKWDYQPAAARDTLGWMAGGASWVLVPKFGRNNKKKVFFPIIYEALPLSVPSAEAVWLRQGSWRLGNGAWLNHPEVLRDLPSPPLPRSQSPQWAHHQRVSRTSRYTW